jgi:cytochrome c-type biogenesis protein CcmF
MCIFGTFLTRSGIVSSVHAFAQSSIGGYFLAFIVITLSGSLYLLFDRLPYLKSENQMESFVSRESSFLFNNLILLAACFAVLWGTMLPVLSEAVTGEKITVGPPFFNRVNVPIAIFLMFLTGVGPLLAWRKASTNSLKRNFLEPALMSLMAGVVLYFWGVNHFYAWLSLVMSIFVALTIFREFHRGARARAGGTGENYAAAVINLTLRNTRRYGGYIIHFAFVLMFIGWAGQAFVSENQYEVGIGETFQMRQYTLRVEDLTFAQDPNYDAARASVGVYAYDEKVAVAHPERRTYRGAEGEQPTTEVAILSTLKEDLYLVYAGTNGEKAIFQLYLNPLVMWVWIGAAVMIFGTLIALLPNKKSSPDRRPKARVEEGSEVEHSVS